MAKSLQEMINDAARANNVYFAAQEMLNNYCIEKWGYAPSDMDADEIIDAIYGGCGTATGMSAKKFREIMDELKC